MVEILGWTTPVGSGIFFAGLGVMFWGAQSGRRNRPPKQKE
jgi:uncharacterized membrane protein YgdD (TMEM256/DUF423 family)